MWCEDDLGIRKRVPNTLSNTVRIMMFTIQRYSCDKRTCSIVPDKKDFDVTSVSLNYSEHNSSNNDVYASEVCTSVLP
jgi:hypothetical protein